MIFSDFAGCFLAYWRNEPGVDLSRCFLPGFLPARSQRSMW